MNGLAAVGAPPDVGSGNVDRNRFEQINIGVLKLRDHFRRRSFSIFLEVATAHQMRRDDQPQRFRANSRAVRNDEITKTEKRFVFLPNRNVEKSIGADDEKDAVAVAVVGVAEIAHGVHGVVKLRAAEIFAGLRERRNEMRMFGASERGHGKTVREWSQVLFELVRRAACRNEMNFVEIEAPVGGASDGEVAIVNRVEGAAEQRDTTRVMLCGGAMRLRGGQCASREVTMVNFLTNF